MFVLEIDENFIKIVQGKFESRSIEVEKAVVIKKDVNTLRFLNDALKGFSYKKEQILLAIPRAKISLNYHVVPSNDPQEISQMVKYHALRQLPYSQKDLVYSYSILGKDVRGSAKVMLIVAKESFVREYIQPLRSVKIRPYVTLNSLALASLFLKKISDINCFLVVDIDYASTNICVIGNKKLLFSREIGKGAEELLQNEQILNLWVEEVKRSVSAYEKERLGPKIEKSFLTGVKLPLIIKQPLLENIGFDIQEVPSESMATFLNKPEAYPRDFNTDTISWMKVIGLLTLETFPKINLTPSEILRRQVLEQKWRKYVSLGVYLFFTFVGVIGTIWWEFKWRSTYLYILHSTIKEMDKKVKILERRKRIIELTLSLVKNESSFLNVLRYITLALPSDVQLQSLDYRRNVVRINGVADSSEKVYDFNDALRNTPIVKSVENLNIRVTRGDQRIFSLNIVLK